MNEERLISAKCQERGVCKEQEKKKKTVRKSEKKKRTQGGETKIDLVAFLP